MDGALRAIRIPAAAPPVDLAPLNNRLQVLESAVKAIEIPQPSQPVNIVPLTERVNSLDRAVRAIDIPPPAPATDLAGLRSRLDRIEALLRKSASSVVSESPAAPAQTPPAAAPTTSGGAALQKPAKLKLFSSAVHGAKDDLKRISGVGPKLEGLLNDNGVFYFWQVASWDDSDIEFVDQQLDVFKGRIKRDEWVRQASGLKREPGSARQPG